MTSPIKSVDFCSSLINEVRWQDKAEKYKFKVPLNEDYTALKLMRKSIGMFALYIKKSKWFQLDKSIKEVLHFKPKNI